MLIRNRSRAVTSNSKQALMTDHTSKPSSNLMNNQPNTTLFGCSHFKAFTFGAFTGKSEPLMSPTSILDAALKSPFWYDPNQPKSPNFPSQHKRSWENLVSKGISVALAEDSDTKTHSPRLNNRMVLANLRLQIPPFSTDFGTKTAVSGTGETKESPEAKSPVMLTRCLSITEMELSEDYTCVISHGPNPKTTHIFENCIVENYCSSHDSNHAPPKTFLSFCFTCSKSIEEKHDIYIYRGEKAFCSQECRYKEMLVDQLDN